MSRLIYVHNPHQTESQRILEEIQNDPELSHVEVIDFMEFRKQHNFRATPALWIMPDGADIDRTNVAVELSETFMVQQVKDKISTARKITLSAPKTVIQPNEILQITASMTDMQNNPVSIEPVTFWLGGLVAEDSDGKLDFSAPTPGVYIIETKNADSVNGYLEVVVGG